MRIQDTNDQENTAPGKTIIIYPDNSTLLAVPVSYTPHSAVLEGCKVRMQGSGGIKVWQTSDRTGQISIFGMPPYGNGPTTWTIDSSGNCAMPETVYVEGSSSGTATLELIFYRMYGSTESEVTRDAVKFTVVDNVPPAITIAKPAVDLEYVTGTTFIKAYITDASGIYSAKVYVDGILKGNMSYESNYWRYNWDTAGTTKGNHTLRIDAQDNSPAHNQSSATRTVYCHPAVTLDQISFQGDHTLWDRQNDVEIQEPQWASNGSITKPFAYTVDSQMTANVRLLSTDVTGSVNIRYTVNGSWKNSPGTVMGTYSADKNTNDSFPCWLAHYPTALSNVMDYSIDQTYTMFVRRSNDSDWCQAGYANATHPRVYLTFGDPIGPWGSTSDTPPVGRTCWSSVIQDACEWMGETGYPNTDTGKLNARKRLAYKAYWSSGFSYTGYGTHCANNGTVFYLFDLLTERSADCQDMSSWWAKLNNSVGLNGQMRRINVANESDYLSTKPISPAGISTWSSTQWDFHQVGVYTSTYDPCLQLNSSSPRVPQDENINGVYKDDLYDYGDWNLQNSFSLTEVH